MTVQDSLKIIKQVLDAAVKNGLFAKTEDVEGVNQAFRLLAIEIQNSENAKLAVKIPQPSVESTGGE